MGTVHRVISIKDAFICDLECKGSFSSSQEKKRSNASFPDCLLLKICRDSSRKVCGWMFVFLLPPSFCFSLSSFVPVANDIHCTLR
jgi:hypothetical protein